MSDTTFGKAELIELAQRAIQRYARDLISVDWLYEQLAYAVPSVARGEVRSLEWLAHGLCIRALCEACLSREERARERGFEHLRDYLSMVLTHALRGIPGGVEELRAETLQQTMLEIVKSLRAQAGGPEEPAAFLKWARVILFRQLSRCRQRASNERESSLEEQAETAFAVLVDRANIDPLETVLLSERVQELRRAIAAMRNPQYRAVLINIFFVGLEERELAARWHVRVCDISLWRCRALKALRKQAGLLQGC